MESVSKWIFIPQTSVLRLSKLRNFQQLDNLLHIIDIKLRCGFLRFHNATGCDIYRLAIQLLENIFICHIITYAQNLFGTHSLTTQFLTVSFTGTPSFMPLSHTYRVVCHTITSLDLPLKISSCVIRESRDRTTAKSELSSKMTAVRDLLVSAKFVDVWSSFFSRDLPTTSAYCPSTKFSRLNKFSQSSFLSLKRAIKL